MSRGKAAIAALLLVAGCGGPVPAPVSVPPLTAKEQKIAEVLIKYRAESPAELAREIVKLKRPRLATAVAIVESNGRNVRGASGEKGIWQIIEREHGIVPDDIKGQAEKFEDVMEGYLKISKGRIAEACRRYNSGRPDRSYKYSAKVLAKITEVPR